MKLIDKVADQEFYIQLKDYSGSKQYYSKDIQGVKKDIGMIYNKENSMLVFILSLNNRLVYENQFNLYFNKCENLVTKKEQIPFNESQLNGIQYYVVSRKK